MEHLSGERSEVQPDRDVAAGRSEAEGRAAFQVMCAAALLLVFLCALRIEKVVVVPNLSASFYEWLLLVLPEVGFVFLWAAGALVASRLMSRLHRLWFRIPFFLCLFLLYALSVAGHQFYRRTGAVQDVEAVAFAVKEFVGIQGVLATGIDFSFWVHASIALACFLLSLVALRSQRAFKGSSIVTAGVLAAAGLGFTSLPVVEKSVLRDLSSHFARDMFAPADFLLSGEEPDLYQLYEAPKLEKNRVARKPNIVFLIMESTRVDVVGAYGLQKGASRTPTFDRLAQEGWLVDRAYTTVSHTSKALVSIFCGMYPRPQMKIVEATPGELPLHCLPHMLRDLGYRTGFFQSAKNFENRRGLLQNLGFETGKIGLDFDENDRKKIGYLGWDEQVMLQPALDWANQDSEPFFLAALTLSAHDPYENVTHPKQGKLFDRYVKAVGHVDRFLGELLDGLKASGKLDNTIIVMLGDHGEAFAEHRGRRQHDIVPYEEVIRIPFLVHAPQLLGAPRRVAGLRQSLDLVPTVLDLLGAPWQGRLPGKSLRDSKGHDRLVTWCWYTSHCMSMLEAEKKYVFHFGRDPMEVFNLATDPLERVNLADATSKQRMREAERHMLSTYVSAGAYYGAPVSLEPPIQMKK